MRPVLPVAIASSSSESNVLSFDLISSFFRLSLTRARCRRRLPSRQRRQAGQLLSLTLRTLNPYAWSHLVLPCQPNIAWTGRTSSCHLRPSMLACGPIQTISQRQHLSAPCAHTSEVVGAGTNFSFVVPVNGVLQELHIRQGVPTAFYLDSASTVFVATDDTAIKKSVEGLGHSVDRRARHPRAAQRDRRQDQRGGRRHLPG